MNIVIRPFIKKDWASVSEIYTQGIATGIATFETEVPSFEVWNKKFLKQCRIIAESDSIVIGFGVLSQVSKREVYKGVAEVTVYVAEKFRGKGVGKLLLNTLIEESEQNGFWTLQAAIFSENMASIKLHEKCGFRVVGIREKIGQRNGKWYDNHFLERRSKSIIDI